MKQPGFNGMSCQVFFRGSIFRKGHLITTAFSLGKIQSNQIKSIGLKFWGITLPETNVATENRPSQNKLVFQPSIFRCELFVSGQATSKPFIFTSPPTHQNPRTSPSERSFHMFVVLRWHRKWAQGCPNSTTRVAPPL